MYAFNITDDIGRLEANHDLVVEAGGTCVMACINLVGLAGLEFLHRHAERADSRSPRHARARSPASDQVGIAFRAWQKLARLSGADHLHTNGISNKFYESDAEVLDSIAAVRDAAARTHPTVPVLSSGQWGGLAHATYAAVGTTDLLVLAGGGIHGHPDGATAGVHEHARRMGVRRERGDAHDVGLRRATSLSAAASAARRGFGGRDPCREPAGARRFYGDDFTGSVDALLQFARRGWTGRLFVGSRATTTCGGGRRSATSSASQASPARFPTAEIEAELRPVLDALAR